MPEPYRGNRRLLDLLSGLLVQTSAFLLFSLFFSANVLADARPTLYVSFDKSFDGVDRNGAIVNSRKVGIPALAPGRQGNALKSGPPFGYLEFLTKQALSTEAGSVEMWVRPLDWEPADGDFHVFFQVRGEGALYLYKYFDSSRLLMLSTADADNGPYYSTSRTINWKTNEWNHLVGTWSRFGLSLYVNGHPVTQQPVEARLPMSLNDHFRIGDHPWNSLRTTSSLIDEVRIYDYELSKREVFQHYQGIYDYVLPLDDQGTSLSYSFEASEIVVQLKTDADLSVFGSEVRFYLTNHDGMIVAAAPVAERLSRHTESRITIPDSGSNSYLLVADIKSLDGREALKKRLQIVIPKLNYDAPDAIRAYSKLLAKTAPTHNGSAISVWERNYIFENAAFPKQIVVKGKEILAGPIAIESNSGQGRIRFEVLEQRMQQSEMEGRAVVESEMGALVGGRPCRVRVTASIEGDGLVWFKLMSATGCLHSEIKDFSIVIPIRNDSATLRHVWSGGKSDRNGGIPIGDGVIDKSEFVPFYWIGTENHGVFWFAESAKTWPNGIASDAIQLERNDGVTTFRMNIKKVGQALPATLEVDFGLQATPVKAERRPLRRVSIDPAENAVFAILWPSPTQDSTKYYGYPEAANPLRFKENVHSYRRNGMEPAQYLCPTFLSTAAPEWKAFGSQWGTGFFDSISIDVQAFGASLAMVSPTNTDWIQFYAEKMKAFVQSSEIRALYLDNIQPYGIFAPHLGIGYVREGRNRPEYPILAYRRLIGSLSAEMASLARDNILIAHSSGNVTIPILSHVDAYVNGEQFRGVVKDNYLDVMSLEEFRAEFTGTPWGVSPIFLPEFNEEVAKQRVPTRGLMALLMIHDVPVWPIWCNKDEVDKALEYLHSFGYENADFVQYSDPSPPGTTAMKDVYISAYKRGDGQWLLIVANLGRRAREGQVCINSSLVGARKELYSLKSGSTHSVSLGNCFESNLDGLDYEILATTKTARSQ